MTKEQYKRATDILKRNEMLHRIYDEIANWEKYKRLDSNDARLGFVVRSLICDDDAVCLRFHDYLANEITICEEEFKCITDNGWISVEDALPAYDEKVLLYTNEHEAESDYDEADNMVWGYRSNDSKEKRDKNDFAVWRDDAVITHWRRLKAPK